MTKRAAEPCLCGAEDCPRCYPSTRRGRLLLDDQHPDPETMLEDRRARKDLSDVDP